MIYFIQSGQRPYVKIGFCGDDARVRMACLQVGSVEQLTLIGTVQGEASDEREWHRKFDYLRVRGEWFEYTPELRRAIGLAMGLDRPSPESLARSRSKALAHLQRVIDKGKRAKV